MASSSPRRKSAPGVAIKMSRSPRAKAVGDPPTPKARSRVTASSIHWRAPALPSLESGDPTVRTGAAQRSAAASPRMRHQVSAPFLVSLTRTPPSELWSAVGSETHHTPISYSSSSNATTQPAPRSATQAKTSRPRPEGEGQNKTVPSTAPTKIAALTRCTLPEPFTREGLLQGAPVAEDLAGRPTPALLVTPSLPQPRLLLCLGS